MRAGRQGTVEGKRPFAVLVRPCLGDRLAGVEHLDRRAGRCDPGDHGIARRLDADDVESRHDGRRRDGRWRLCRCFAGGASRRLGLWQSGFPAGTAALGCLGGWAGISALAASDGRAAPPLAASGAAVTAGSAVLAGSPAGAAPTAASGSAGLAIAVSGAQTRVTLPRRARVARPGGAATRPVLSSCRWCGWSRLGLRRFHGRHGWPASPRLPPLAGAAGATGLRRFHGCNGWSGFGRRTAGNGLGRLRRFTRGRRQLRLGGLRNGGRRSALARRGSLACRLGRHFRGSLWRGCRRTDRRRLRRRRCRHDAAGRRFPGGCRRRRAVGGDGRHALGRLGLRSRPASRPSFRWLCRRRHLGRFCGGHGIRRFPASHRVSRLP